MIHFSGFRGLLIETVSVHIQMSSHKPGLDQIALEKATYT